jgi:ABC-type oligopeptide transport system substrate-binding subunit
MRALANDIQSEDGVANAAIHEAAQRLEEHQDRIKRLEEAGDAMADLLEEEMFMKLAVQWRKAKEAKL